MTTHYRPELIVDLNALKANFRLLSEKTGTENTAGVVKADAYGLGVEPVAQALFRAGCRTFFTAYPFEGAALRGFLGNEPEIFVLNGTCTPEVSLFGEHNLIPVLNTIDQVQNWMQNDGAPCALHFDTGMNRLGLDANEINELLVETDVTQKLNVELVLSHYACASDPTAPENETQIGKFRDTVAKLITLFPNMRTSLSASAGLFLTIPSSETLTRPGIGLYGASPQTTPLPALSIVASLHAPVLQVMEIKAGQSVGYGATYTAKKRTRVATLGVGYGDGYPRSLSNVGHVWLGQKPCPIIGTISMDLTTVDITDCPELVSVGDMAECFGKNISIESAANAAGTIPYELIVRLGPRIHRMYVND